MAFEFNRNLKDENYVSEFALADGGSNSTTFDLEQIVGGDIEAMAAAIAVPAAAGVPDAETVTFTVTDSADGSTFAALDPSVDVTATGAGGTGIPASNHRFRFPPSTRRYVRLEVTNSGTITATEDVTFELLF